MPNKVIISADSTCDLGTELSEQYGIKVLPFRVEIDGAVYEDGVTITTTDLYRIYDEKKLLPKTSATNIGEYADWFRRYTDQGYDVVHICLGSGLSSSYQNACLAAGETEGVYIVDSCNLSTGMGLLVLAAADRARAGMPAAQIAEEVQALTSHVEASFVIDTLEFLYKGGRCSALAMLGANLLKLKPCIEVDNTSGKMDVSKKYRGTIEKCLEQYVEDRLKDRTDLDLSRIF
ncbi:MAG: DegV family protein, partial [Clostridia bacterium]|nr:DegV family protein [Clostridia bacterium]